MILLQFCTKIIAQSLWPDAIKWPSHMDTILQIVQEHQLDPIPLPTLLTAHNVKSVKTQLLTLYKIIYKKAKFDQRQLELNQI